MQQKLGLVMSF